MPQAFSQTTAAKACTRCEEVLPAADFYLRKERSRDTPWLTSQCKACLKEDAKRRSDERREFVNEYKVERGCMDCGYAAHPQALDLDHRPGEEKSFTIGANVGSVGWERLLTEIDKCDVVCANCHRIRTYEREEGWYAASI